MYIIMCSAKLIQQIKTLIFGHTTSMFTCYQTRVEQTIIDYKLKSQKRLL